MLCLYSGSSVRAGSSGRLDCVLFLPDERFVLKNFLRIKKLSNNGLIR